MNETSGKMKQIMELFLNNKPLNPEDLLIFKRYTIQYIDGIKESMKNLVSKEEYQKYLKNGLPLKYSIKIYKMNQKELSEYIIKELLNYGIDPL